MKDSIFNSSSIGTNGHHRQKKKKSYKNQLQMDQGLKQKTVIKLLGKNLEENLQWAKSS